MNVDTISTVCEILCSEIPRVSMRIKESRLMPFVKQLHQAKEVCFSLKDLVILEKHS